MIARRVGNFRARHAIREQQLVRRLARRAGYDTVRAGFYSPIVDPDTLSDSVWTQADPMAGVSWDLEAQLRHLQDELGPERLGELDAPLDPPGDALGFHLRNAYFHALDAEVLYATVRWSQPRRVLELGSGFSTLLIARALAAGHQDGPPARHQVVDPHPSALLGRPGVRDRIELSVRSAAEIPLDEFSQLISGDVLFIDTSHAVRPGGEVVHILLGALPLLAPGVLVHIHDFFRPYEYPRVLIERYGVHWQEHHLVQAFLAYNDRFEILCACSALARLRRDQVRRLVPGLEDGMEPSSLWLRRL